jgi:hypothetical protein
MPRLPSTLTGDQIRSGMARLSVWLWPERALSLDDVRCQLDRMVESRLARAFSPAEEALYRDLCERERALRGLRRAS